MPHTINGIGTWYYGKERLLKVHGTCSQCGASGQLLSYDTTSYFVFVFVPIIPLGKYRVIEECPACQKHRRVKLKDWEELKAKSLAEVREQMRTDGDRHQAAMQALSIAIGFQDEPMLRSFGAGLAADMTDDAEVQSLLGAAYTYFGHDDDALAPLTRALKLKDDPDGRRTLAAALVRLRRPDDAEKVLASVVQSPAEQDVGTLVMLAEGHQSVGQHARAIQLLERCAEAAPAVAADKEYKKLLAKARKYQGSTKPLVSRALSAASSERYQEGGRGASIARWLFPVILAIAACGYFFAAWKIGQGRKVYVVNGLPVAYTAMIGGESVPLGPETRTEVTVPEGDITVSIDGSDDFPPETVHLATSFLTRPFNGDVYVINPDRTAVLAWEKQWYGNNLTPDQENEWTPSAGKVLHRFDDVDFEFAQFPEQLTVSSSAKSVTRTRVDFQKRSDPAFPARQLLAALMTNLPPEELAVFARYWATGEPENEAAIGLWRHLASSADWIAWAKPLLDRRPVLIDLHRVYQSTIEEGEPDRDLQSEYQQRLDAHPEDQALQYLVARVTDDPRQSRERFLEAARGEQPIPHVLNALAFDYLVEGEFADAERYARQAVQRAPDSSSFRMTYQQSVFATQNVADLLADVDRKLASGMQDPGLIQEKLSLLAAKGDFPGAAQFIQQAMAPIRLQSPEFAPMLEAILQAQLAYAQGDKEAFRKHITAAGSGAEDSFPLAVTAGDPALAAANLDKTPPDIRDDTAAAHRLLIYLLFTRQGQEAEAQQQLDLAVKILAEGRKDAREVGAALEAKSLSAEKVERLLAASNMPDDKRTFLTALGLRHPDHQPAFFALARKLNYQKTFPYLTLKDILQ